MLSKNIELLNKSKDIDSRDKNTLKKKNNFMKDNAFHVFH